MAWSTSPTIPAPASSGRWQVNPSIPQQFSSGRWRGTRIFSADLDAELAALVASMQGGHGQTGILDADLRAATAALTGVQHPRGSLAAQLRQATAVLLGQQAQQGTLSPALQRLSAQMAGQQIHQGSIGAALKAASAALAGQHAQAGALTAALKPATASFGGKVKAVVFDAHTNGGHGPVSTRSWSHTNAGNCIVVAVTKTTSNAPSCTYGGVNIPLVYGLANDGGYFTYTSRIAIFALVDNALPTGANTVAVTQCGTASAAAAWTFKDVDSIGTVSANTASGNVNKSSTTGIGRAAVYASVGGSNNFGALTPTETLRESFVAFDTWASVMGYGLDTGSGINFAATHSGAKTGALVPLLP
jgi:hypothetical protein